MKLSDYIIKRLEEHVKHVFLISGGGCIHLVDSLSKSKIKLIPNLHEQASSICAESYAQYTNNLGVALVTTGPGTTNPPPWMKGVMAGICRGGARMTMKIPRMATVPSFMNVLR